MVTHAPKKLATLWSYDFTEAVKFSTDEISEFPHSDQVKVASFMFFNAEV
jgi:hypothetical protein